MPRGKPGSAQNGRSKSNYFLFAEQEDGTLYPLKNADSEDGSFEGRNANDAVSVYLATGVDPDDRPLVIVPGRNLSRVRVEVENVRKVKVASA